MSFQDNYDRSHEPMERDDGHGDAISESDQSEIIVRFEPSNSNSDDAADDGDSAIPGTSDQRRIVHTFSAYKGSKIETAAESDSHSDEDLDMSADRSCNRLSSPLPVHTCTSKTTCTICNHLSRDDDGTSSSTVQGSQIINRSNSGCKHKCSPTKHRKCLHKGKRSPCDVCIVGTEKDSCQSSGPSGDKAATVGASGEPITTVGSQVNIANLADNACLPVSQHSTFSVHEGQSEIPNSLDMAQDIAAVPSKPEKHTDDGVFCDAGPVSDPVIPHGTFLDTSYGDSCSSRRTMSESDSTTAEPPPSPALPPVQGAIHVTNADSSQGLRKEDCVVEIYCREED